MDGVAMLSLMIAQSALLGVHPRAGGEDKSEKIRQLLRINGFEKQISKAPDTLKAQLRAKQARSGGNRDEQAYVEEVVFEAFKPAAIPNRVIANMAVGKEQGWLRGRPGCWTVPPGPETPYHPTACSER